MTTVKLGSRGKDVEIVQAKVGVKVDGVFGPNTDTAVKEFQKQHGLTPDGIVGSHTWARMGFPTSSRQITEIILHCSATKEGVPYSSEKSTPLIKLVNFPHTLTAKGKHVISGTII